VKREPPRSSGDRSSVPAGEALRSLASPHTRRAGPLQALDDALLVLRRAQFGQVARAWLGAVPLGAVALALYYLERVEGMRVPRLPFAAALLLAFWLRFYVLSLVAREFVQLLRPSLPLPAAGPAFAAAACSASVSALGLWFWAWPMLVLAQFAALAMLAAVPLFGVRGALAPSFLARSSCAPERGFGAFARALADTRGVRGSLLAVELMVCAGLLGVFANLYALGALALVLANAVLGLDVAFLNAFLAPDNEFVTLSLFGATLLVLEPVRAAVSALAFAEARGRQEGADLHAAIDALALDRPAQPLRRVGSLVAICLLLGTAAAPSEAQQPGSGPARDGEVRERVREILARGEFHEFDAADSDRLRLGELFERWFGRSSDADPLPANADRFDVSVSPTLIVVLGLGLVLLVGLFVALEARKQASAAKPAPARVLPLPQPTAASEPPHWLADAAALAEAGRYHEALRALYSATLHALGRAQRLRLAKSHTNGDYLRALEPGTTRQRFAAFTDAFERSFYGSEPVDAQDYEQQRRLAEWLRQPQEPEA
jgi:hypothetical protein